MSQNIEDEMKITVIATDFAGEKVKEVKPKDAIRNRLRGSERKEET